MIGFRQCDARCPLLWDDASQPEGRWHGAGEGPAHYFADTPDGAWADFLRHEEIRDPADLVTIRRAIWVVDLGDGPAVTPEVSPAVARGDRSTYAACQEAARRLRAAGHRRLRVPAAALQPDGARGHRLDGGESPASSPPSSPSSQNGGTLFVLFGDPAELGLVGWPAAVDAAPPRALLARVRHY
jgi:RES domain